MDLKLVPLAEPTAGERAALDEVLGTPASGWEGGARETGAEGNTAAGGHAARERRHLLLPALWALQERIGWISPGGLNEICRRLSVPPADAFGVATFYALFALEPRPPRVVHVCDDIACRCHGSDELVAQLEERFGPEGELSDDGSATWYRSPCLGQCDRAPAAVVAVAGDAPLDRAQAPTSAAAVLGLLAGVEPGPPPRPRSRRRVIRRCASSGAWAWSTRRASTTTARTAATMRCDARSRSARRASSAR